MSPTGQTICLCMIVKNEAHVIRRCLDSVRPIIDCWLVVDTGSTDGTQDIVRAAMADLPGELVERPWRNFAINRSESLTLGRPLADYSLIIDADDMLEIPADYRLPELIDDWYLIDVVSGNIRHQRPHLVKASLGWRYEGVLHEFLECDAPRTQGHLPIIMRIVSDGARRSDPDTYRRDAALLEDALTTESRPMMIARYVFYLAQSYRDCGEPEKALAAYLRRADQGFWDEEIYCALLEAGRLQENLGHTLEDTLAVYERAMRVVPARAEASHAASRLCRLAGDHERGARFGKIASDLPIPAAGLFLEVWIYQYGALDEYAVNAYWTGRYRESLDAALRALARGHMPAAEQPRFVKNAQFALEKWPRQELSLQSEGAKAPPIATPRVVEPARDPVDLVSELSVAKRSIVAADVGAAFFGERPLYQPLIDRGLATLICFEPDDDQVATLQKHLGQTGVVLPYGLGDGSVHLLRASPGGMSSLLEPDQDAYNVFSLFSAPPFSPVGSSVRISALQTRRLNDLPEVAPLDFIKIDVQGSELMVLKNGAEKLRQCSIVQVEVPFVPLYKDAPTFGDIDAELRSQGFMVHGFATMKRLPIHPYNAHGVLNGINQLVDLDMIYIRDIRRMESLPTKVLINTIVMADLCYQSFDLAHRCLVELTRRDLQNEDLVQRYLADRRARRRLGYIHLTPMVQEGP